VIYFETHATSLDNEAGIASGENDVDLSQAGERQAHELGLRYRSTLIDRVLCSDLRRSWRTAGIAFAGCGTPVVRDHRLKECSYGDWNGAPAAFIDAKRLDYVDTPFPNGQSYSMIAAGIRDCLADNSDAKCLLIIGHRATYYALRHLIDGVDLHAVIAAPWQWQPGWSFRPLKPFGR
jgi:broad specificity phosphatase PhoE